MKKVVPVRLLLKSCLFLCTCLTVCAQGTRVDTTHAQHWNFHFQQTVVTQYKFPFKPTNRGPNTLLPEESAQTSLTSTLFIGRRLWKGAELYINPEIAGGTGLSGAHGIAGFTNGETFRIGNPKPQVYVARLFVQQIINLTPGKYGYSEDGVNQLAGPQPTHFLYFSVGRFGNADYFDNNTYSHDPRSQFLNWSLMSTGAWDYPANTRGYTWGVVAAWVKPGAALRFSSALMPKAANGSVMDWRIRQSHSETLEWEKAMHLAGKKGIIRLLAFRTQTGMGNYRQALLQTDSVPDITATRRPGRTKYGFGINLEQALSKSAGAFLRASWNDGRNETWAFTEIDRSVSGGVSLGGSGWRRSSDQAGIALVANGISPDHRAYLQAGGSGFMLGDGTLRYGPEVIAELYYAVNLPQWHLSITPDYQCVLNPGYNRTNAGPVHIVALRAHLGF